MTLPRLRLICLGDSLTQGLTNSELERWPVQLALGLEKQWPGEYEVFTRAFSGATTADALDRLEGEAGYLLPGVVLIALGINDALVRRTRRFPQVGIEDYLRNLEDLARMISARGGKAVFVVQHVPGLDERPAERRFYVPGNGRTYRDNYEPYRRAMLAAGRELNTPVIDLPRLLDDAGKRTEELVMPDGLHLTDEGNAIYARLILAGLEPILPELAEGIERRAALYA